MKRGKLLAALSAIAGVGMLALGAGTTAASAQVYVPQVPACAAGFYYANGYCYPYQPAPPPVTYYPPAYYAPPPVIVGPTFGIGFGFGGGWHGDHDGHGDFHDGGGHHH